MRLGVFAYDWPHRKTQDVLVRLWLEGLEVACVVAAERVELDVPSPTRRVKPRHLGMTHPREIADRMGVPYRVVPHSTPACAEVLREHGVELGVIAGARVLKGEVLDAPETGILNLHPGLIPEVRGLDALKWAVHEGEPLGVTAHLIDERVDAGRVVLRRRIDVYPDDTLLDLWLRLYETEIDVLPAAIDRVEGAPVEAFDLVGESEKRSRMPPRLEAELDERLEAYLERFAEEPGS